MGLPEQPAPDFVNLLDAIWAWMVEEMIEQLSTPVMPAYELMSPEQYRRRMAALRRR